jgi:hypothetical protein
MDPIALAIESGSKSIRVLPGYGWSADGESIVLSQGGRSAGWTWHSGEVTTVPFSARVQRTISEMAYRALPHHRRARSRPGSCAGPPLRRTAAGWPFQGVGKIWVSDLPPRHDGRGRASRRDPGAPHAPLLRRLEYAPTWSPDGRWIAFVSRDDAGLGHLWKVPAAGGTPQRLTPVPTSTCTRRGAPTARAWW